jgi:starch synthase
MENKRILYISQEIHPYLPENDISRAALALPKKMNEIGHQVRVFMPRFGVINERRHQLHEVIRLSGINIVVNDIDMPLIIKVASVPQARMQVYFIDNDEYFKRKATVYDEKRQLFSDNDERSIFFAKGVIETVKKLGWKPDIIHIHGWMPSLVPMYLKLFNHDNPLFADSKVVYSIYNGGFEGNLGENMKNGLLFDEIDEGHLKHLDKPSFNDLNKAAVDFSHAIVKGHAEIDPDVDAYIKSKGIVYFDGSNLIDNPEEILNVYKDILVEEESVA